MTLEALFEKHAAASLDKQVALSEVVGDADWQLDLDAGTISFGHTLAFPVQVLGTESEQSNTWLWAWANAQSNIPARLLTAAGQLRQIGMQDGIREFTDPQFGLRQVTGHQIALVAAGVCQADCYFRGPYEGGAVFLLLDAPVVRERADASPLRLIRVFNQLISTFPLDHRRTLMTYLEYKGYMPTETATGIDAAGPAGATIQAKFDRQGRLTELTTTVVP